MIKFVASYLKIKKRPLLNKGRLNNVVPPNFRHTDECLSMLLTQYLLRKVLLLVHTLKLQATFINYENFHRLFSL